MVDGQQPLPDPQSQVIAPLLPTQCKRRHSLRQIIDAMRYICRMGCQWRSRPTCFPPWPAVYYYFAQWRAAGTLERLSQVSNRADRLAQGRLPTPSLALVDAQSVKLAPRPNQQRGLDAHKRVNGRKRQVLCGTGGRNWRVQVHLSQHLARLPPEQQAATLSPFAVLSYRHLNLHGEYDCSDQSPPAEAPFDMGLITAWQPPTKPGQG